MKNRVINLITAAFFLGLIACGGGGAGSGSDAPAEAEITTSVSDISWSFADTVAGSCSYVDSFIITVKDKATNVPLSNVRLTIFNSFAVPNTGFMLLYDGDPNDGGHGENSPMTVTTDKNGTFTLFYGFCGGIGYEYSSPFTISSGPLNEVVPFDVSIETAT